MPSFRISQFINFQFFYDDTNLVPEPVLIYSNSAMGSELTTKFVVLSKMGQN